ncbi:MAG: carboxylesterase/lipase family protein [Steroidobacteraceae bacterium]
MKIARRDVLKLGAGLGVTTACGSALAVSVPGNVVRTTNGPVRGLTSDGVQTFKGIRYGAPPIGPLRFMPPQLPEPWTDVIDARDFGNPAIQVSMPFVGKPGTETEAAKALKTISSMFLERDKKPVSEDCLFLNLWTPSAESGKRPVMVWLHGGGFETGSGALNLYDGSNLARKSDIVLVTVNHRLNALGFLYLGDLMGPGYTKSGNAGMLDLVLMLQWVRDNIGAFGGDPTNVTIFGESGGAAKVSTLMGMPAAQGLFHKAIIQSGGSKAQRKASTEIARRILAELKIKPGDIESLQAIPVMRLLEVANAAGSNPSVPGVPASGAPRFAPVIDGEVIKSDYWDHDAPAQSRSIPLLTGFNKDEATLITADEEWFGQLTNEQMRARAAALFGPRSAAMIDAYRAEHPDYPPTYVLTGLISARWVFEGEYRIAEAKAAQGGAPVWMYYLAWTAPIGNGVLKSPHILDVPLMFDNIDFAVPFVGDGAGARKLAHEMSTAWVAFARTGNPNTSDLPKWPAFDSRARAAMRFDSTPRVVRDPDEAVVRAMRVGNPVAS